MNQSIAIAEQPSDDRRACRCSEKRHDDADRNRHDHGLERGRSDLQPFDRRQDGDRRCEDRVAIEE
jgi:hypothetical protein